jgi:hypothetical protein
MMHIPTLVSALLGFCLGMLISKYILPQKKMCLPKSLTITKKDGSVLVDEEYLTVKEIESRLEELRAAEKEARSRWCDLYYKVNGNRGTVREIVEAELLIQPARKKLRDIEKEEKHLAALCKKAIRREIIDRDEAQP